MHTDKINDEDKTNLPSPSFDSFLIAEKLPSLLRL